MDSQGVKAEYYMWIFLQDYVKHYKILKSLDVTLVSFLLNEVLLKTV